MIILKDTKKQGFTQSLEDLFLEKPQRGADQIDVIILKWHKISKLAISSLNLLAFVRYRMRGSKGGDGDWPFPNKLM